MKNKKILLSLLLFVVTFLLFSSKYYAVIAEDQFKLSSNNYLIGDYMNKPEIKTIGINETLQINAFYYNIDGVCELCKDLSCVSQCGPFVKKIVINSEVSWESSNTNVVTVDNTGKITGISIGNAEIIAIHNDNRVVYEISVSSSPIPSIKFLYEDPGPSMVLGSDDKITVSVRNIQDGIPANLEFKIENETIAKVVIAQGLPRTAISGTNIIQFQDFDCFAIVHYLSVGKTKLIASLNYNGETYTDTMILDVVELDGIFRFSAEGYEELPSSIKVGDKIQLNSLIYYNRLTITPLTVPVQDIIWESSDESVASVHNGQIVAKSEGNITISAKYNVKEGPLKDKTVTGTYNLNIEKSKAVDIEIPNPKTGYISVFIFALLLPILLFIGLIIKNRNKIY